MKSATPNHAADRWLIGILREQPVPFAKCPHISEHAVMERGGYHGILSLVAHLLSQQPQSAICPATLRQKLRMHVLQSAAGDLAVEQELKQVFLALDQADIPFLLLKGAALAHNLYPAPYLRERCDVDLLFPDKTLTENAWDILQKHGYQRSRTLQGDYVGYQFSGFRQLNSKLSVAFDIHSKINDYGFFARLFPFTELMAHSQPVVIAGRQTRGLSHPYALAHACIHRATNIPHGIADRMIWIVDIHLLCSSFNAHQWREFETLAIDKGLAGICLDTIDQSRELLGTAIPTDTINQFREAAKKEKLQPAKMRSRRALYQLDFHANQGLGNKMRQLREHLFPSPEYMMNKYSLNSPLKLPYYYGLRIIQGFKKYSRQN